mgnify:CR=1 FL=1
MKLQTKLCLLGTLALASLSGLNTYAHGMGPMILKERSGSLMITNQSNKSIRVFVDAYPVNLNGGVRSPAGQPYRARRQRKLVYIQNSLFRVRKRGFKSIKYRIKSLDSTPFYLCSLSTQGSFSTRVCSLWEG